MVGMTVVGNALESRGHSRGEVAGASGWGATSRPSSWFKRLAAERTRLARLARAFEELRIDIRGKRLGSVDALYAGRPGSFDVIVSSLEVESGGGVGTLSSTLSSLKDQLPPGGVLCVFVRTNEASLEGAGREHVVWSVASSIAHAGFEVVFAEGSRQLEAGVPYEPLASRRLSAWRLLAAALRSAVAVVTSQRFRERVASLLDRSGVRPRQALVVARRTLSQGLPPAPALARRIAA